MRNKFTRFFSSLPFYLFPVRAPNWCLVNVERIAGIKCRCGWCMGRPSIN
uniref:Uncharacterized protein n=1 Tax=Meloidogyne hapla TaxID=6305 RepID=A0A1I8BL09_MELHA